uniref:BK_channel_a domain-containing protein n=1 Tax=Macrostomum lignano TaxID=282301 RepID=A0A1I8F2N9_9PLAT
WAEEVFGMSCFVPSSSGAAFIENFNTFESDFLAKSEYCIIIISEVAAKPLNRFLARLLVFVTMRAMWRSRFIFIALGEFEGLKKLHLDVSVHDLIIFKSRTEEGWMVETECWKALYFILNISWASLGDSNGTAENSNGAQSSEITESTDQLDKAFKLILMTSRSYSKESNDDGRGEAFAQFLQQKSESEFSMSCKIPSSSGSAFITDFNKFENEFLRVSEYCLIVVSEESVRRFRIFLPRLLVFLTRRSVWSNRFIIACVVIAFVDLRESEVDFLTHPPVYFTSTEAESWSTEVQSWQILYRILRITWAPTDAESQLAKISFDADQFYHTVVFTSIFYSTSAEEQPDDCTGWQFASYFSTKMSNEYKLMVYVLTARDAVQVETLDELEIKYLQKCGNLVFIVTEESVVQFTQFLNRLQQFLSGRVQWRNRLTLVCVGNVQLDESHLALFGSSVITIYSSERSSWTSIESSTWTTIVTLVRQNEIITQEELVQAITAVNDQVRCNEVFDVKSTSQTVVTGGNSRNATEHHRHRLSQPQQLAITNTTHTTSSIDVTDSSTQEKQEQERQKLEQERQDHERLKEQERQKREQERQEQERQTREQERQGSRSVRTGASEAERSVRKQERQAGAGASGTRASEAGAERQEQERQKREGRSVKNKIVRSGSRSERQEQERQKREQERQEQERQKRERQKRDRSVTSKKRQKREQERQNKSVRKRERERQEQERRKKEQERLEQQQQQSQTHSQTSWTTTTVTKTTTKTTENQEKLNVSNVPNVDDVSRHSGEDSSSESDDSNRKGEIGDSRRTSGRSSLVVRVMRVIHTRIVRITILIHSTTVVTITRIVTLIGAPVRMVRYTALYASQQSWLLRILTIIRRVLRLTSETIGYVSGSRIAITSGGDRDDDVLIGDSDRRSRYLLLPAWLVRFVFYASGRFIACRTEAEAKAKLTQQVKGGGGAGVPDATGVSAIQTVTDWRDENCAMCHQLVVDGLARVRGVGEGCPYTGINFWATMTRRAYYWSDVISDRLHVYSRRRAVAHGFLCVPFLAAGPGLLCPDCGPPLPVWPTRPCTSARPSRAAAVPHWTAARLPAPPLGAGLSAAAVAAGPVWINPLLYKKAATESERELFAVRYNRALLPD